jgi:hypothetical protein
MLKEEKANKANSVYVSTTETNVACSANAPLRFRIVRQALTSGRYPAAVADVAGWSAVGP